MASKEIQQGRKSSGALSTPPDSPDLLQPSGPFTPNDVHQLIEIVKAVVANPTPYNTNTHTPPEDPTSHKSSTLLTIEHFEKLVEKLIEAKSSDSASDEAKPGSSGNAQPKESRASKLNFKTVNEMYVFNQVQV